MGHQLRVFDVIVLGSGPGGLMAATLLAKEHRSVLFLKENSYHPSFVREGYRFVPFSNFSERLIKPHLMRIICQTLDLSLHEFGQKAPEKQEQKVSFQVILPQARIDLFDQGPLSQREMKREFPEEIVEIKNLYGEMARINQRLMKGEGEERRESLFPIRSPSFFRRLVPFKPLFMERLDERLLSFSKEFREFIRLQMLSLGNLNPNRMDISLASYLLFNDQWGKGMGIERMPKPMMKKFLHSGGKVEGIEGFEKLEVKRRKGFHLILDGEGREFQSKFIIFNSPFHRLLNLLSPRMGKVLKLKKKVRPSHLIIPIFLGIHEKVIPVGMKDLLVSISDMGKPDGNGNVLFLSLSPKGDESQAPSGRRALLVEGLMDLEGWNQNSLVEYQSAVMKHLKHLIPFLEHHIEFIDLRWAGEQIPKISYPHFIYETDSAFQWREGLIPPKISKNHFFVGKENFPFLGLEGELLAGLMIGKEILKRYRYME